MPPRFLICHKEWSRVFLAPSGVPSRNMPSRVIADGDLLSLYIPLPRPASWMGMLAAERASARTLWPA